MLVLICEDDPDILELLEILISSLGHNVLTCKNSLTLIPLIEKSQPDLLLLDYWLNEIKVDAVVREIKNSVKLSHIPIILISAVDNLDEIAAELNVSAAVKKPFDINVLQNTVQKYVTTK